MKTGPAPTPRPSRRASCALALVLFSGSVYAQPPAEKPPENAAPANPPPPTAPAEISTLSPALEPFEGRVIREVKITGIKDADEQLVANQIRSLAGRPLSQLTVQQDIQRCTRLGRFKEINAKVQPFDDGTVLLSYEFFETPIIKDVQAVGNREISDQELRAEISILAGTPVDKFQLDRIQRRIEDLYKKKGFYEAKVEIDQKELQEQGIVVFRIREGERLKITDIRFEGNASFSASVLRPNISTTEAGIFNAGVLDDNIVDQDVANLIKYYKDHGYLDVRGDHQIRPSPDGKEAILTYLIEEGPVYTLRSIKVVLEGGAPGAGIPSNNPTTVLSQPQVAGLMPVKIGDVFSVDKITKSVDAVRDAYGKMGYVDVNVARAELRDPTQPKVDLLIIISEGRPFTTGLVPVRGNQLTQDKIIRRHIRVKPDRPLDTTGIKLSEQYLAELDLFGGPREGLPAPRETIQAADPATPGYRDVLVEVEEKNTGSVSFGAAVSSDAGLIGQFQLTQRNFDIADFPDSWSELFAGRAFRGAGQTFNISIQPGTETQNYSIGLSDPYFLGSDYSISGTAYYRVRDFNDYNESRLGVGAALGRRFGDRWSGAVFMRAENIDISNIAYGSPDDYYAVAGWSTLTGVGARFNRTTVDSRYHPSSGTNFDAAIEQCGALGGTYAFTKLSADHALFLTLNEDELGRKTVFSLRSTVSYIPQDSSEVPYFERYYLGGRTLRGFAFRGVSPRGISTNPTTGVQTLTVVAVGGTWAVSTSPQVEFPVFQKMLSIVTFIDTGTVLDSVGLSDIRVGVGAGVRLNLPQLGPAPLAFDVAFPLRKDGQDNTQIFSFSVDIPF